RRVHRAGKGIALQDVATQFLQDAGMLHGFDAFGAHLDAGRLADIDDRFDQPPLGGRCCDRRHQPAVYLEAARLELEQADDRRVAGSEIVDLDIDAEFLDLVDVPGHQLVALVEEDGFDQLERQLPRLDAHTAKTSDKFLVLKASRRYVDRYVRYHE